MQFSDKLIQSIDLKVEFQFLIVCMGFWVHLVL